MNPAHIQKQIFPDLLQYSFRLLGWTISNSTVKVLLVIASLLLVNGKPVHAVTLFNESFSNATLSNPASWVLSYSGSTSPCLTAADSSNPPQSLSIGSIGGCQHPALDGSGSGALRLTPAALSESGMLLYDTALPTAGGLDITFSLAQYGGGGADGIGFFVKDGSNTDTTPGTAGGGLGYAAGGSVTTGIHAGLFGIGFDKWGNFSASGSQGTSCPAAPGQTSNSLAIRGPDTSASQDGTDGYCFLAGTSVGSIDYSGGTRSLAANHVRIVVDPSSVASRKIHVYIGKTLPVTPTLEASLPAAFINASTFKFGFAGSTGGVTDIHEVWGLNINTATPSSPSSIPTLSHSVLILLSAMVALGSAIYLCRRHQ